MPYFHFRLSQQRTLLLLLVMASLLGACGFHLRGAAKLPFRTIYLDFSPNSPLGIELRRYIRASEDTKVVSNRKDAEAALEVVSETRDKSVLTLNSQGRPREFVLFYRFTFRVVNPNGNKVLLPATTITLKRDVSYNETEELSADAQEALLYKDMQSDTVQQILRRLSALTITEEKEAKEAKEVKEMKETKDTDAAAGAVAPKQ